MQSVRRQRDIVSLRWGIRVRWIAAAATLIGYAGIAAGDVAGFHAPAVGLAGLLLVVTNTALWSWSRTRKDLPVGVIAGVLVLDAIALTAVLALSGGPSNPFAILYLFPLILGALLLETAPALVIGAMTVVLYGSLFWLAPWSDHHHDMAAMRTHLYGMFVAYAVCGAFILYALLRLRAVLALADAEMEAAQQAAERSARLISLATLAAGAAHELATPLGTIAVAASELERSAGDDVREDLKLILDEVARCKEILVQLSSDAGSGMAEAPSTVVLPDFLEEMAAPYGSVVVDAESATIALPRETFATAVRRLLGNARDASDEVIELRVRFVDGMLEAAVRDRGAGIAPEILERVTEPFFTTKPAGEGRGLGLYYVDRIARELGGSFELHSTPGRGTSARLRLPARPA